MSEGWTRICELDDVCPVPGFAPWSRAGKSPSFASPTQSTPSDNFDPASEANVLSRGLVGDLKGERVVASPIYKHHYSLTTGRCLEDDTRTVHVHRAKVLDGRIWVKAGGETTRTTCPYCGVGCGVLARNVNGHCRNSRRPRAPRQPRGTLLQRLRARGNARDWTAGCFIPQIDGQPVTWDHALETVSDGFSRIIAEHGPDAVAFYVSGQLLTEDYYVANKLMKGFIGSANIDTNSRLCMASAVAGHKRAFGEDVVPACYEDLQLADLIVLVGLKHCLVPSRAVPANSEREGAPPGAADRRHRSASHAHLRDRRPASADQSRNRRLAVQRPALPSAPQWRGQLRLRRELTLSERLKPWRPPKRAASEVAQ